MKIDNLHKKGWEESDFHKLNASIESFKLRDKSNSKKELNKLLYWMSLLIMAVCNFGISLFLIPFLIVFKDTFSIIIVAIMGLLFGILFSFLIKDIEHLEPKHHLFAAIFVPLIALLNIYFMVQGANFFSDVFKTEIRHNPIYIGTSYIVTFLIPYIWINLKKKK